MPHQKSSQTLKPPLKQREYGLSLIEMATVLAIAGVLILIIQITINGYLKRANSINLANNINEILDNNGEGFFNEINKGLLQVKKDNQKNELSIVYTGDSSSIDKDIIKTRLYSSYGVENNGQVTSIAGGYWKENKNSFSSCSTKNCMFFYKKTTKNGNGNGNGKG